MINNFFSLVLISLFEFFKNRKKEIFSKIDKKFKNQRTFINQCLKLKLLEVIFNDLQVS